ncbi:twin-arginine translocation signal domain-containing protein [Azospirillum sp. ST 5-10]|uniref:twin-arginine translocation signal domain-containing protein n=1 Tax=unclassified Azospirillum TaxID=2630922 RepID=UPI003F4A712A
MSSNDRTGTDATGRGRRPGRRDVLKGVGLAGAGAAAALAAAPQPGEAYEPPEEQVESRYRLNAHVERFYFLNRL